VASTTLLIDTTEEEFDRVFNVNTKGTFFSLQEAAKVVSNGGRIISISSGGTKIGVPTGSAYWGSKVNRTIFLYNFL
jgi:3-oxoacyl-[acyl-carrier protein] reductase